MNYRTKTVPESRLKVTGYRPATLRQTNFGTGDFLGALIKRPAKYTKIV